ncbi:MAG: hypothetical protein QG635_2374, partial [Bacteroidota bacterium]|nr:hypothetical protein [Bacteroidota bacterium]
MKKILLWFVVISVFVLLIQSCGTESLPVENLPPELVKLYPAANSRDIPLDSTFEITFNTWIDKNAGFIRLYKFDDNSLIEQIDVQSFQVKVNGTLVRIKPSQKLDFLTKYYITIDNGTFVDKTRNKNKFKGIIGRSDWSFTAIGDNPYIISLNPVRNETNFDIEADLIITFNKEITSGIGYISIIKSPEGTQVLSINAANSSGN